MDSHDIALPETYRLSFHRKLDSTNAEGLRLLAAGERDRIWIWALEQTSGRGRHGRTWHSLSGNLFASLLLRPRCAPATAAQLAFVAALSVHQAVGELAQGRDVDLELKWPNDLLVNREKAAGVLLESTSDTAGELAVVIGTGINLVRHPRDVQYPATDLGAHGIRADPARALQLLAGATAQWLSAWDNGAGFDRICRAWDDRALPRGTMLEVRRGDERLRGSYQGLDRDGNLVLKPEDGSEKHITSGDIFPL